MQSTAALFIAIVAMAAPPSSHSNNVQCGAYCLYVALGALDVPVGSFADFQRNLGQPSIFGYSMLELQTAAEARGVFTIAVSTNLRSLARLERPTATIALLQSGHFVLLRSIEDAEVDIADPPVEIRMPHSLFESLWTGDALLLSTEPIPDLSQGSQHGSELWQWTAAALGSVAAAAGLLVWRARRTRA